MSINMKYPLARSQKYCLWMNMPSHHQLDFITALYDSGLDIVVRFFGKVDERRKIMGWNCHPEFGQYSKYVKPSINMLEESIQDWRERIHIIPGTIGDRFLMALVDRLIRENINWVHWSESVRSGWNRVIRIPLRKYYGEKINRYALGALAISKIAEKEFISWGVEPKKIRWLPYAENPLKESDDVDDRIKKFVRNRFVFMFSGAMSQRKGTDVLLRAFQYLVQRYPDVVLVIIGPDTTDQYYERYSKKLDITKDNILFTGPVAYEYVTKILSLSHVFILPSRRDGWGMVIFEGASIGKAVIATDKCGVAHHMIIDGVNGFMIKADNVDALVDAMQKYAINPTLAEIHGVHSKVMAELFYPDKNVQRFLCAIESFLLLNSQSEKNDNEAF